MNTAVRRLIAFVGALVLGFTVGIGLDKADVTPAESGDMTMLAMLGGIGLGLIVVARIRD